MSYQIKKIWITGANGRIGSAIMDKLDRMNVKITATDLDVDVTDAEDVRTFADMTRPDVILNCAGLPGQQCARDMEAAYRVNALGPRNLAVAARRLNATIVQLSTDDVFSGLSTHPFHEFDLPKPTTIYGKSRLAGEIFVRELAPRHLIIRSSWIYGGAQTNYVLDVLHAAKAGCSFTAPSNQFGSPTNAKDLAKVILRLIEAQEYGTFHCVSTGICSRFEFAQKILELSGFSTELVCDQPLLTHTDVNGHPIYSALDNMMLRMTGVEAPGDWIKGLQDYITYIEKHNLEV